MNIKRLLGQFRTRVTVQSILKSTLFGILIGFIANFAAAFFSWFFGFDGGLWLSVGVFVGVSVIVGVVLYFTKFRPTEKVLNRRIDMLGLHERIVTMKELEGDDSYIAQRQRADALEKLATVKPEQLKLKVARKAITAISLSAFIGCAMSVVCGLAVFGILPYGLELINPEAYDKDRIEITYVADEGGWIDGETEQVVFIGDDPSPVVAVANDGWMFVGWDDGFVEPYRADVGVTADVTFVAIFEEIDGEGEGDEGDKPEDEEDGDRAGDEPSESGSNESGNGGEDTGKDPAEESENAGGKYDKKNQIYDGSRYYKEYLEDYYEQAMEMVASGDEIPESLREIIETYFGSV